MAAKRHSRRRQGAGEGGGATASAPMRGGEEAGRGRGRRRGSTASLARPARQCARAGNFKPSLDTAALVTAPAHWVLFCAGRGSCDSEGYATGRSRRVGGSGAVALSNLDLAAVRKYQGTSALPLARLHPPVLSAISVLRPRLQDLRAVIWVPFIRRAVLRRRRSQRLLLLGGSFHAVGWGSRMQSGAVPSASSRYVRARPASLRCTHCSGKKTKMTQVPSRPIITVPCVASQATVSRVLAHPRAPQGLPGGDGPTGYGLGGTAPEQDPGVAWQYLFGHPTGFVSFFKNGFVCITRNSDFQLCSLVRLPELNLTVLPIKQLVYIGVRPRGFDFSSWHSVGRTLIRESPSCLLFEILVCRGCCESLV